MELGFRTYGFVSLLGLIEPKLVISPLTSLVGHMLKLLINQLHLSQNSS